MAILYLEKHVGVIVASDDAHRCFELLLHVEGVSPVLWRDLLDLDDGLWAVQVDGVELSWIPGDAVVQVLVIVLKVCQRLAVDALPVDGVDGQMRYASVLLILFLGFVLSYHGPWAWICVRRLLVALSLSHDKSRLVEELAGDEVVRHHRSVEAA